MQIENVIALLALGRGLKTQMLRLTVRETIGAGALLLVATCGLLSRCSEIDQISHSTPRFRPGQANDFHPDPNSQPNLSPVNAARVGQASLPQYKGSPESSSIMRCYATEDQYTVS